MTLRRALLTITMLATVMAPAAAQAQDGSTGEVHEVGAPVADTLTLAARRALAATAADEMVSVVVSLDDQLDLAELGADGFGEGEAVIALKDHAAREQVLIRLLAPIWELGPAVESFEPFWIVNGFAMTARPSVIALLASMPGVREIDVERTYVLAGTAPSGPVAAHVDRVGAPEAWADGFTGEGVVVAVLDTGVDVDGIPGVFPSEVASTYRGGQNSWFDPYLGTTDPYDLDGHGTAVTSIITGGGQSGEVVGVAPGARWIAAKIFDDQGRATTSAIRASLQWVLDPDGDPTTDDGADIVNASWTSGSTGCDLEFGPDIAALRAAGVLPVFAAGNLGPLPGSSPSPANLPGVLAVGALDALDIPLDSSSRGPTDCGGAIRTFPHIAAPGDGVVSQTIQGQYVGHIGTSFAAPHVSGAAAVLTEALGGADADRVEAALVGSARDLEATGPDDSTGAGLVWLPDAVAALGLAPQPVTGTVSGMVRNDVDRSGDESEGDLPSAAVQVALYGPGDDSTFGTSDDLLLGETVTSADGTFLFAGLDAGPVEVRLDVASLPPNSVLLDADRRELVVAAGADVSARFLWTHPTPGSISVTVMDDGVGAQTAPFPIAGVAVLVESAGADGVWGSGDDLRTSATTGSDGVAVFPDVAAGEAIVSADPETLPELGYVTGASRIPVTVASGGQVSVEMVVRVPTERVPVVFVSTKRAGSVGDVAFRDEDVLAWDGSRFFVLFDGSDVGLAGRDVDAVHVVDETTLYLSIDRPLVLDDVGLVGDGDVVRFDATQLGTNTRGTFSIAWSAVAAGLGTDAAADVDAITVIDEDLAVSFRGNVVVGDRVIRDEDLVAVDGDELGRTVFDGSEHDLQDRAEDIDAAAQRDAGLAISTLGQLDTRGLVAGDGDVVACEGDPCTWVVLHPGGTFGLPFGDLDGLSFPAGGNE